MVSHLNENMSWYLKHKFVKISAARNLAAYQDKAVKEFGPHVNDCVEALGVPNFDNLQAPVARDYIGFLGQTNMDNFKAAGGRFDITKGAT
jgi:hypothetical protein